MELKKGMSYRCTVVAIVKYGAVVELEDSSTCLVHLSNIADGYVRNASDYVSVGLVYEARCIEGKAKPLELSFKHLKLVNQAAEHIKVKPVVHLPDKKAEPSKLDIMIEKCNQDLKQKMKQSAKRSGRK